MNDLKYGPVNLEAAKEVKNGGLLSRIVQRRQSRPIENCQPARYQYQTPPYSYVQPSVIPSAAILQASAVPIINPTDCNFGYVVASNPIVRVETGIAPALPQTIPAPKSPNPTQEYPAIELEGSTNADCPACIRDGVESHFRKFSNPRFQSKTGSFVCSHCRKACVGDEWHTDWSEDGTPVTFLCKRCYDSMSSSERIAAYRRYASRQMSNNGPVALMHQEIAK